MNKLEILCYALAIQLVLALSLAVAQSAPSGLAPTSKSVVVLKPKITLGWEYPKDEENYIQGFRIYFGKKSHASVDETTDIAGPAPYDQFIDVDKSQREVVVELAPGRYFFRAVAFGMVDGKMEVSRFDKELDVARKLTSVGNFRGELSFHGVSIE